MPLLLSKRINAKAAYAIWKISETTEMLQEMHSETPERTLHQNKLGEWLATRMLVSNLCMRHGIPYKGIRKDEYGKPHLVGSSAQISISHSFPIASAMLHLEAPCGIDVEWPREKMSRVQSKFLHPDEAHYRDNETALCIIWAAKEAIYKRYGKKQLSFKEDIIIDFEEDYISGTMLKNKKRIQVPLILEEVNHYFLVYSI